MIKDLNQILVEWSYRTSDGKPDVNNSAKLILLKTILVHKKHKTLKKKKKKMMTMKKNQKKRGMNLLTEKKFLTT